MLFRKLPAFMENYVYATVNRPNGNRMLDADLVTVNINDYIWQLKEEEAWKKNDRNGITVFKTGHISLVLVAMHKGAGMSPHLSEGVMSLHVLSGKIKFTANKSGVELKKEEIVIIHKGIEHSITAIDESTFLLTIANI